MHELSERLYRVLLVCVLSDLKVPEQVIWQAARYEGGIVIRYTEDDEPTYNTNSFPTLLLPPVKSRKKGKQR